MFSIENMTMYKILRFFNIIKSKIIKFFRKNRCLICLGTPCALIAEPVGPYIAGAHIKYNPVLGLINFELERNAKKFIAIIAFVKTKKPIYLRFNEIIRYI